MNELFYLDKVFNSDYLLEQTTLADVYVSFFKNLYKTYKNHTEDVEGYLSSSLQIYDVCYDAKRCLFVITLRGKEENDLHVLTFGKEQCDEVISDIENLTKDELLTVVDFLYMDNLMVTWMSCTTFHKILNDSGISKDISLLKEFIKCFSSPSDRNTDRLFRVDNNMLLVCDAKGKHYLFEMLYTTGSIMFCLCYDDSVIVMGSSMHIIIINGKVLSVDECLVHKGKSNIKRQLLLGSTRTVIRPIY